jgi:hypothetical protein
MIVILKWLIVKDAKILHSGGKHFKLHLWNLDTRLQISAKAVAYKKLFFFLENSCKNIQNTKSKKNEVIREKWK